MNDNTIGRIFTLTTFGESHGEAIGGIIDGCPSKLKIDFDLLASEMRRRATGQAEYDSQRKEADQVDFLSGILDGITLGTPIAFVVRNNDARSEDYEAFKHVYRPSHADFTYQQKFGIRDWRGGGRASARTMLPVVVAGAIAKQLLNERNIFIESNPVISADLDALRKEGDTIGGIVECVIHGLPAGLGAPMFHKFQADLAQAMFSIPAVKGFEYGDGFDMAHRRGSEVNDAFVCEDGRIRTSTNHSGGIQGGITNGENVDFRLAFKPIASIAQAQQTVTETGEPCTIQIKGRHDVCAVPRALVLVESLAAMVCVDHLLMR